MWRDLLQREFQSEEGSFLLELRTDLVWNKNKFDVLVDAMQHCAEAQQQEDPLERWLAEGFWYYSNFVRDWSSNPNFPRHHSDEYFEWAYTRLDDLSYHFFRGESPYNGGLYPKFSDDA